MISTPFLKILLPLGAIAGCLLLAKYKYRYSLVDDLQLRAPKFLSLVIWVLIAVCWILVTDWFLSWRGPWDFAPWKTQSLALSIIRIVAVCFLGPIAEELIFRGLLLRKLINTGKLHVWMVVMILSAGWALLHYNYSPAVVFIIFVQGMFLGFAAVGTRSIYVPIAMHIAWNLYAIW